MVDFNNDGIVKSLGGVLTREWVIGFVGEVTIKLNREHLAQMSRLREDCERLLHANNQMMAKAFEERLEKLKKELQV